MSRRIGSVDGFVDRNVCEIVLHQSSSPNQSRRSSLPALLYPTRRPSPPSFGGPKLDAYKKLFLETASNAFSLSKSDTLQKIFKFLPDRKDPDASTWHNTGSRLTAQRDAMTKLGLDPLAWKDEHTEFDKKSMDFKKKEKAKATDAKAKSSKAESSKAGGQKAGGQLPSRVVGPKRAGGADDAGGKSAGEDEVDDPLDDIPKPKAKGRAKGKAAAAKGKAAARKRKAEGNDEDAEPDAKKPKQD